MMKCSLSIPRCGACLGVGLLIAGMGCSTLKEMASLQAPEATVEAVRFDHLSFTNIGLVVDVLVDNPNAIPVSLAGLSYSLAVEGEPVVQGSQTEGLEIGAGKQSKVSVPVGLNLPQIYPLLTSLPNRETFPYDFKSTLDVDLPVLGKTAIPVAHQGELPVIRPPQLQFGGIRKDRLNLLEADLTLLLQVDNPNAFDLKLNEFDYQFTVDQQSWALGKTAAPMEIGSRTSGSLEIPISLNFLQMGKSLYSIVTGKTEARYELTGDMELDSSLPLLNELRHPFRKSGDLSFH